MFAVAMIYGLTRDVRCDEAIWARDPERFGGDEGDTRYRASRDTSYRIHRPSEGQRLSRALSFAIILTKRPVTSSFVSSLLHS